MLALTMFLAAAAPGAPGSVEIAIGGEGAICPALIEGRRYILPRDEAPILALFARFRRQDRDIAFVLGDPNAPYRCIGNFIYLAQRARLGFRFGPIPATPPAR